ncbi:hypothetical protein HMPREF0402_01843 [Fusobacterium ulcerans 12-1B]|uniref:Uncharacterized protein n=1 Tax=Fusobacterium ulcerans 12-1B TaxID=457404 RepID=H1PTV0_9FUSO|nr:hypothetical protein HMPREF0402_01843 [Fusobacterium ulcerans 12-1B]
MVKIKHIFILLILTILFYVYNNNKLYRKRNVTISIINIDGKKNFSIIVNEKYTFEKHKFTLNKKYNRR